MYLFYKFDDFEFLIHDIPYNNLRCDFYASFFILFIILNFRILEERERERIEFNNQKSLKKQVF